MVYRYIISGGDDRLCVCADILSQSDRSVSHIYPAKITDNTDIKINNADFLVLPIPVSRDNCNLNASENYGSIPLSSLTEFICDGGIVFGGKINDDVKEIFKDKNISFVDFMDIEEFTTRNAHMTAEGAVSYLIENSDKSLFGIKILIVGSGRIGKILAHILKSFGCDVTVTGRNEKDIYLWRALGYNSLKTNEISDYSQAFDAVFNTVPFPVIDEEFIKKMKKDAIIIDLASKPGGTDFLSAKKYKVKAVNLLGVPGKYFPGSSGEMLAKIIIRKEREYDERRT